jgi:DNA-binding SARP family transcriptional activator
MGARETLRVGAGRERTPAAELPGPALLVRLLGGFGLQCDGAGAHVGPTAARLIAFVALEGRPLQRRSIVRELWPELSAQRAVPMLRSTLWRLEHSPYPLLDASGPLLALPAGARVDARELAGRARVIVERGSAGRAPGDLELVAGAAELLPGWFDDWVVLARERLRQLRLHALEALSAAFVAEGRFEQATTAARAATRDEPLRESAHRCLIRAQVAAGRADLALDDYQRFRRLLAETIGAVPSPLMESLVRAVRKP